MQMRLTARTVQAATSPGYHPDGAGLYLQVTRSGGPGPESDAPQGLARSWIFRYKFRKRAREMGLGSARFVTLAEARLRAAQCRQQIAEGNDPLALRQAAQQRDRAAEQTRITFDECAKAYIAAHRDGWRNAKHAEQWENTLRLYATPVIGAKPVADVGLADAMKILDPIWRAKTETASRLRGRIEAILDWATVRGHRAGDNPARWRGHLDHLLPTPGKVAKVVHHAAMQYRDLPEFVVRLRQAEGLDARALEFAILTAARSGEVRGATWGEFDLVEGVWTVPGDRMKAAKEHRVPLSAATLHILRQAAPLEDLTRLPSAALVFPSTKGTALSDMTLSAVLRRMKVNAVPHGFRSTFRDWCAEQTDAPREVAEMALAHTIGDKVEAAYRRSDLFEKRRALMVLWGEFCALQQVSASQ